MKIRCPTCQTKLAIPDKYAGKTIRCPSCNKAIKVPAMRSAVSSAGGGAAVNLEDLAKLEAQTTELSEEERIDLESQAAPREEEAAAATVRVCPHCNYKSKVANPLVDVLCPHCWKPIPALVGGAAGPKQSREYRGATATGAGGFYSELASSVIYPLPALSSLLTAAGIAFMAALAPVAIMTGAANLMEQSAVGTAEGVKEADLSNVQLILIGVFAAEVFVFAAIAIHAFLDVVRTTSIGDDAAPKLSFSPNHWGKSFGSYVLLSVYVAVATYIVAYLTVGEDFLDFLKQQDVNGLIQAGGAAFVVGMLIVLFFVPMNLLGMSLGSVAQALNPVNVVKSVGRTHAHYVFLVLILVVYGGIFGYAFVAIMFDWFMPQMNEMTSGASAGKVLAVAPPLLAWGGVMVFFFYGSYVLARLHGLFARSFRKQLEFGTL